MKTLFTAFAVLFSTILFAQVQINKPIQLTGGTGERVITNLETPVNGTDAVNKDYVDAAVAASGSSMPTEMSNESVSTYTYMDAIRYCRDLTENTHSDWKVPTILDFQAVLGTDGVSIPNETSANYFWLLSEGGLNYGGNLGKEYQTAARLSAGGYFSVNPVSSLFRVRCVR